MQAYLTADNRERIEITHILAPPHGCSCPETTADTEDAEYFTKLFNDVAARGIVTGVLTGLIPEASDKTVGRHPRRLDWTLEFARWDRFH